MWTLWAILVITATIVFKFIKALLITRRPAYPSESLIDQVLPPEILEQIFVNADYESLLTCYQVSKYWHYIISDKQFRNRFYATDTSWRIDPRELLDNWNKNRRRLELDKLRWLDYPESYKPEWKYQDQIVARTLGKKLVDVEFDSAIYIKNALDIPLNRKLQPPMNSWRLKFRARVLGTYNDGWQFVAINKSGTEEQSIMVFHVYKNVLPKNFQYKYNAVCEFIVDLKDIHTTPYNYMFTKIHNARYIHEKLPWLGISLDVLLFNILTAIFTPCLIHDYWQINSTVKFWINLVFATISALCLYGLLIIITWDQYRMNNLNAIDRPRRRVFALFGTTILIIVATYFYWTLELGFLCGCLVGSAYYTVITLDLQDKNHPYAKHTMVISSLLLLLMIDWKLVATAIGSGKILSVFLFNSLLYLSLGALMVFHNATTLSIQNLYGLQSNFFKWNRKTVRDFAMCSLVVLFVTLSAPETTSKVWKYEYLFSHE